MDVEEQVTWVRAWRITAEDECGCGKLNWIWSVGRMDDSLDTGFHRGKRTTYIDPSSSWCLRISGTSSQVYNTLNTRPGGSGRKPSGPAWYRLLVFLVKRRYLERLFKSILKIAWYASYWSNLKCPFDPRVEVRIMGVRKRSPNSEVWLGNIWFLKSLFLTNSHTPKLPYIYISYKRIYI